MSTKNTKNNKPKNNNKPKENKLKDNTPKTVTTLLGHNPNGTFAKDNAAASKYDEKYCEEILAYFMSENIAFPTFEDFASSIGVLSKTLKNWADNYDRFGIVYASCLEIQKHRLLVGGLVEQFNPQIVKFIAINNHGMKEKIEQDVKADASINVNISFFDDADSK